MRCFHRTTTEAAENIITNGFQDPRDEGGVFQVWLSAEHPVTPNEGADGDAVLSIEVPESVFEEYEWEEDEKPYRETAIPAEIVNRFDVHVYDHDWAGVGLVAIRKSAQARESLGRVEEAKRLHDVVIPFLTRYDLLENEGPVD